MIAIGLIAAFVGIDNGDPSEMTAVSNCLAIIRNCQLPDGAFIQVNNGRNPDSVVWVAPYFANYAALALIANFERQKTFADLERVGRWLDWCSTHQTKEGFWCDYEGTVADYQNNQKVDAWDSSAATFLLTAGRFQRAGGKVKPKVVNAAKSALKCIQTVTDKDGLTWAKPMYKVKFLMDNIEVYAGLVEGARFFQEIGAVKEAKSATDQANLIGKMLPQFWRPSVKRFAYALHENSVFEDDIVMSYPHGLAQLFGVAFVSTETDAWIASKKFPADEGPAAAVGSERWLIAASRIGSNDAIEWRKKLVKEAAAFTSDSVYVYRAGVAVLGLLEGADWMPNINKQSNKNK
jgi:hypothetical protein